MSQENVEVVRRAFAAWNAGDMEAFREFYDPDVIVRPPEGWPEPGPFVGREAVMRQWEQLRATWDAEAVELISDFIDAADRVAVRQAWRGAGQVRSAAGVRAGGPGRCGRAPDRPRLRWW